MNFRRTHRVCLAASISLVIAGCAATQIETTGSKLAKPLCSTDRPIGSVVVFWQPQWRADQKEPELREAAALRGIEQFFSSVECTHTTAIQRLPNNATPRSDAQLLQLAEGHFPHPDRTVYIVVRELGPTLAIGLPVIIHGGTEVVVEVRVLDPATSASIADARTHWRNGGAFVLKGVKTLGHDMTSALTATLMATESP